MLPSGIFSHQIMKGGYRNTKSAFYTLINWFELLNYGYLAKQEGIFSHLPFSYPSLLLYKCDY